MNEQEKDRRLVVLAILNDRGYGTLGIGRFNRKKFVKPQTLIVEVKKAQAGSQYNNRKKEVMSLSFQ